MVKNSKFLYTDGKDVVVTQSILQTGNGEYRLKGITNFSLDVLKPQRLLGFLLTMVGIIMTSNLYVDFFIPVSFFDSVTRDIKLLIGVVITLTGVGLMSLMRKRYALRIETAEGDKHVVVSKSKQYIDQIISAIRRAKLSTIEF